MQHYHIAGEMVDSNSLLIHQMKYVTTHAVNRWNPLTFNLRNSAMLPRFNKLYNTRFLRNYDLL